MQENYLKLELKEELQETGIIKCYAAVFNNIDSYNDIILPGAFKNTLANHDVNDFKFCLYHDTKTIIGKTLDLKEDDYGLYVEAQIIRELPKGEEAYILVKNGVLDAFSIGYQTKESHYDSVNKIRYLDEIELKEFSLVSFPANPEAKLLSVKSAIEENNIKVDDREKDINEDEIKELLHCEEIPEELTINGKLVYGVKNNELVLNFKAVENLTQEEKQINRNLIQTFYKAFRAEFKDYSIVSSVCDLKELINIWELKDIDKFLKSKGLTNTELKMFYKRIMELKDKKEEEEKKNTDDVGEHLTKIAGLADLLF